MKAVRFEQYGGPEVLRVEEIGEPHAQAGQIRIAVRAAGVNGLEWKIRQGFLKDARPLTFPAGVGLDAAGIVDEVGKGVTDVEPGVAVFGSGIDTYAEYAVLTSWARKPANISFEEAAGYPIPFETALRILQAVGVTAGQTLLVSGAAGGVGSVVVQIARERGIAVIGTAGSSNQEYLTSLGATATVYGDGFVERVRALAPKGIDAALDIAGSGVIPQLIELTGNPKKVLSIADFSAPKHGALVSSGGGDKTPALREAARLAEADKARIPVERTFSLSEAGAAQAASAKGHVRGRFIVTVP